MVGNADRNDFKETHLVPVRLRRGHPEVSVPGAPGSPVPHGSTEPVHANNITHVRDALAGKRSGEQQGSDRKLSQRRARTPN